VQKNGVSVYWFPFVVESKMFFHSRLSVIRNTATPELRTSVTNTTATTIGRILNYLLLTSRVSIMRLVFLNSVKTSSCSLSYLKPRTWLPTRSVFFALDPYFCQSTSCPNISSGKRKDCLSNLRNRYLCLVDYGPQRGNIYFCIVS